MARPAKKVIEYRIYEIEPEKPFMCLHGDEWRISDVLSNRLHFHNCLEIGYCFSDSGFISFENGSTISFKARDIFLIPRFVPHTTCSTPGTRSRWNYLFIDPDVYSRTYGQRTNDPSQSLGSLLGNCLRITPASHPRLYFLCKCMLEEAKDRAENNPTLFSLYSTTMVTELRCMYNDARSASQMRNRAFVLRPALEYINDHYTDPCSVDKLAGLCHLSQTHFRRLFLSIMGTTPLQYVIQIRIRQACVLLNTTSEPITAIAQAVGISSISSFNRNFQQIMNVSPQQYRQAAKPISAKQRQYILPYKGWLVPEE